MDFQPIENYAVVGNMRAIALVGTTGSIDFFCYPRFDSPSIFCALLDPDKGGFFCIRPELKTVRTKQMYLPESNVLLTRFLSDDGVAEVTDCLPIPDGDVRSQLVRRVSVIQGEISFKLECRPRFDYARITHTAEAHANGVVFTPAAAGHPTLVLQGSVPLQLNGQDVDQVFTLKAGEEAMFVLGEDFAESCSPLDVPYYHQRYAETIQFWRTWIGQSNYTGRWREMVHRSALLLKLLFDREYGSLIAAPTFGLPEALGGERNWDYRYTWLRDSAFTLYAMMRLGFVEEAEHFRGWIGGLFDYDSKQGPLQVLYRIDGSRHVPEETLDHLRGYRDSRPVRIGNGASNQLQLDIYGELMDSFYLSSKYGDAPTIDEWESLKRLLRWLADNWQSEDEGIWEVRGGRKPFLHSRLMSWVAFDRALRLGAKRSLAGPYDWMEKARDDIYQDIVTNFWNPELKAFVQYKGSNTLDAAVLLMPLMRFITPTDPKWLSTLEAIERELTIDTLVFRYRTEQGIDGLAGREGSFTACSFWFIEALARSHQVDKARLLFEKMLGYANHVGLYSEELGEGGEHLGNFPQALTHLALISAATYLDRVLSGEQRASWQ